MKHYRPVLQVVIFLVTAAAVWAGGGPQNVLIVVNERSADSLALGRYYQEKRGIPERNLCRISVPPGRHSISAADFEKDIRQPIEEYISQNNLRRQIDYLALCMDAPTRVNDNESITAALFYGFKGAPGNPPCKLPDNTASFYYRAERAFTHDMNGTQRTNYLVMMLTAPTLDEAKRLVDRGVASDGTAPSGTFYLLKPPGDTARNVRYKLFEELDFSCRLMGGFPRRVFADQNVLTGLPDVMGYMTGLSSHPEWFWNTNTFLPGAIADHFTSFGAQLPRPGLGQSSVLDWIAAGATASYGTVAEPCSFLEKFPDPMVFFWYARGFNLAESYWMSVAHPYQGLFVGEPLAAPYAQPPIVTARGLSPGQLVSGVVTVEVTAAATTERPCAAIDLYVDDLFVQTITNVQPKAWNDIYLELDDLRCHYITGSRDGLPGIVQSLAREVRTLRPAFNAIAYGDRLLIMDGRLGKPGTSTPYRIRIEPGLGPKPEFTGWTLTPTLLDSTVPVRMFLPVRGKALQGDAVECVVTLTNGQAATNRVEAAAKESAYDVAVKLTGMINSNPLLMGEDGVRATNLRGGGTDADFSLEARQGGTAGLGIQLKYRVLSAQPSKGLGPSNAYEGRLGDNLVLLGARGAVQFACGREKLSATLVLDTTAYPDGSHTVRIVARGGTAVQTQGHLTLPLIIQNRREGLGAP